MSPVNDPLDGSWLVVTRYVKVPIEEFTFTFSRSSGPGGQNVNKVNTKVRLRWAIGETTSLRPDVKERFSAKYRRRITADGDFLMTSQRYRDQLRNINDCLEKLREMLATVVTPPVRRKKTKPTKGSRERRLKQKREQSGKKQSRRRPRIDD